MKFPFDFNIAFVFRLVLPGCILAAAFTPLVLTLVAYAGFRAVPLATLFPIEAVAFGWLVVLLDQPIYMLYEGRRWWPRELFEKEVARQQRRLDRLTALSKTNHPRQIEWALALRDFPVGANGEPEAQYPSRLGNLLAASETYAYRIYGADAVFYWPRLWLTLDKDLRGELDQTQAIADSGLYTSFASLVLSGAAVVYWLMGFPRVAAFYPAVELAIAPPHMSLLAIAACALFASYALYRLHLHPQRQYGELVMALFDQFLSKLTFVDSAAWIAVAKGGGWPANQAERYKSVVRLLRYNFVRPAGAQRNIRPR